MLYGLKYVPRPGTRGGTARRWCSGVLSILAVLTLSSPLQGLTFDQAWNTLQQQHGSLRAAEIERERIDRLHTATRSLLLPQINLEARYTRLKDPIQIDLDPVLGLLPSLPGALPPLGITIQDQSYWKANISAIWPLYTGGRISAARAVASLEREAASEHSRRAEQDLHSQLVQRYFAVLLAQEVDATRQAVLAGARQHLHHAERMEAEGLISHAEKLHAHVEIGRAHV